MNKADLDRLMKAGKIRGYSVITSGRNQGKTAALAEWQQAFEKEQAHPSNSKAGFKMALTLFCHDHGLPLFQEQVFHVKRKWRLDFLIPGPRPLGIEYEGIFSDKSRHTTRQGFINDGIKYRAAGFQGITVIRYTAKDWKQITEDLKNFYHV